MLKKTFRKFIVVALAMVTSLFTLLGCGSAAEPAPAQPSGAASSASDDSAPQDQQTDPAYGDEQEVTEGAELLCLAETKEEAQKIADLYGIELVDFGYGVATFHTDRDPEGVIKEGLEKGYPELSINGTSKLY